MYRSQSTGHETLVNVSCAAAASKTDNRTHNCDVVVDLSRSATAGNASPLTMSAPAFGGTVDVRVFVDGSVLEVYVSGGRAAMTARVYNSDGDGDGMAVASNCAGCSGKVAGMTVWEMNAAFQQ